MANPAHPKRTTSLGNEIIGIKENKTTRPLQHIGLLWFIGSDWFPVACFQCVPRHQACSRSKRLKSFGLMTLLRWWLRIGTFPAFCLGIFACEWKEQTQAVCYNLRRPTSTSSVLLLGASLAPEDRGRLEDQRLQASQHPNRFCRALEDLSVLPQTGQKGFSRT